MPVDETLARFSDWSYTTSVVVYLLAIVFSLVEQAFGRPVKVARKELAAVGGGVAVLPERPATPVQRSRPERFGRMGVALTVLGVLLHAAALLLRGLATGRAPWGNMYEYGATFCLVAVVTWLVVLRKFPVRRLTAFVLLPIVILMFLGGTALYVPAAPVMPALQSYWLAIHVSVISLASGVLLVPGVASLLYLARAANERNPAVLPRFAGRLPAADVLDRLAYRTTVLAFPLFTIGIICGAIWAESAWGRFWGWDPKETTAFVAWVIYAAYLHARATAGWRGTRAAIVNSLGFAAMVFNLFFVNLVTTGLHSYAGLQ